MLSSSDTERPILVPQTACSPSLLLAEISLTRILPSLDGERVGEGVLGMIRGMAVALGSDTGGEDNGVEVASGLVSLPGVCGIPMGLISLIPLGGMTSPFIGGPLGACTGTGNPPAGGGGVPLLGD